MGEEKQQCGTWKSCLGSHLPVAFESSVDSSSAREVVDTVVMHAQMMYPHLDLVM